MLQSPVACSVALALTHRAGNVNILTSLGKNDEQSRKSLRTATSLTAACRYCHSKDFS